MRGGITLKQAIGTIGDIACARPYHPDLNYVLTSTEEKCLSCALDDCVGITNKVCPIYRQVPTRGQRQYARNKARSHIRP